MTDLNINSSLSNLHCFLGQTGCLHVLLLSPTCPLHGSLSYCLVLQLQPLSRITFTPTALLVGHSGAVLGTGAPLLPGGRVHIVCQQAGVGHALQQERTGGVQEPRKKMGRRYPASAVQWRRSSFGGGKPLHGFLHRRVWLQWEHWRVFLLPCLSVNWCWSHFWEMSFCLFHPDGFFMPGMKALLGEVADLCQGPCWSLCLNPGLQNLLWYKYQRDLKLSFLQSHNHLALQYHRLLLSLVFVSSSGWDHCVGL